MRSGHEIILEQDGKPRIAVRSSWDAVILIASVPPKPRAGARKSNDPQKHFHSNPGANFTANIMPEEEKPKTETPHKG